MADEPTPQPAQPAAQPEQPQNTSTDPLQASEEGVKKKSSKMTFIALGVTALGVLLLIGITFTFPFRDQVFSLLYQFIPGLAWKTSQSAYSICGEDGLVDIHVSFSNTEPAGDQWCMTVVATDLQTGASVNLGDVHSGETVEKIINTNLTQINAGEVEYSLTWCDGRSGKDSRKAQYNKVETCQVPTPTPTPEATPTPTPTPPEDATPTPTPEVTPSVTPGVTPSVTPTPSAIPTPTTILTPTTSPTPFTTTQVTSTPTPTLTPTPTNTPGGAPVSTPTPTITPSPTPIASQLPATGSSDLTWLFGLMSVTLITFGGLKAGLFKIRS